MGKSGKVCNIDIDVVFNYYVVSKYKHTKIP